MKTPTRARTPPKNHHIDTVESFELAPMSDAKTGPRRISGVAKEADKINLNRRYFSLDVLKAIVEAAQTDLKDGSLIGLVQHPDYWDGPKGRIENIGIRYDKLWMDGKKMMFEGELVGTTQGQNLLAVLDAKIKVGMSTQVTGSAKYLPAKEVDSTWPDPEEMIQVINDDARLVTIDAVMNPADVAAGAAADEEEFEQEDTIMKLDELKQKDPEGYKKLLADMKAELASESNSKTLEDQLAAERAARQKLEKDMQDNARKGMAEKALADAKLPKLGKSGDIDLDARFAARVVSAAQSAADDTTAQSEVAALIAERKALMGNRTEESDEGDDTSSDSTKNNPGLGKTKTDKTKQDAAQKRNALKNIRSSVGL